MICGWLLTSSALNSNIGAETSAEDVLASVEYAEKVSALSGLPLIATTAEESGAEALEGKISNLFSLKLQSKIINSI